MIEAHLELAREVLPEAIAWHRDGPPRAPIAGDELAAAVGIEPGPELGPPAGRDRGGGVHGRGETPRTRSRWRDATLRRQIGCRRSRRPRLHLLRDRRRRRCRPRSSTPTSTRSPSWTSPRRPAGHALVIPREHSAEPARDLRRRPRAHDARRAAPGRADAGDARARRLQRPQRLRRRRLADRLSLPRPRGPALRRRPAEAALGPGARATATRSPRSPAQIRGEG